MSPSLASFMQVFINFIGLIIGLAGGVAIGFNYAKTKSNDKNAGIRLAAYIGIAGGSCGAFIMLFKLMLI